MPVEDVVVVGNEGDFSILSTSSESVVKAFPLKYVVITQSIG